MGIFDHKDSIDPRGESRFGRESVQGRNVYKSIRRAGNENTFLDFMAGLGAAEIFMQVNTDSFVIFGDGDVETDSAFVWSSAAGNIAFAPFSNIVTVDALGAIGDVSSVTLGGRATFGYDGSGSPKAAVMRGGSGKGLLFSVNAGTIAWQATSAGDTKFFFDIRWAQYVDGIDETGADAGSDWRVDNYADNGNKIGTALLIARATGNVTIAGTLSAGAFTPTGDILPATDSLLDLGSTGKVWAELWVDNIKSDGVIDFLCTGARAITLTGDTDKITLDVDNVIVGWAGIWFETTPVVANYALLGSPDSNTLLNSKAGTSIEFRINNVAEGILSSTAMNFSGVTLAWGGGSALTTSDLTAADIAAGTFSGDYTVSGKMTVATAQLVATGLAHSPAVAADGVLMKIGGTIIEAASGVHANLTMLKVNAPTITGGVATVTNATTLKITGAPAASGATNFALWIDDGVSRFDGDIIPGADSALDLGSTGTRWANLWVDDITLTAAINIGGALNHDGSTVGFYATAPISKQTGVAVDSAGIHAACVALGLFAA